MVYSDCGRELKFGRSGFVLLLSMQKIEHAERSHAILHSEKNEDEVTKIKFTQRREEEG